MAETAIDKTVEIMIWRKGQEKSVRLKVGELKEAGDKAVASSVKPTPAKEDFKRTELKDLGVTVVELSDATRQKYSIPDNIRGLVVVEVDDSSDAALKGLRPGDVIDEIQQTHIGNIADADAAIHRAKDGALQIVLLRVMTRGGIRYVPLKMAG